MLRLITDFDGPIIDVSTLLQRLQILLDSIRYPDQPVQQLGKAEFWQLKRSRVPEKKSRFFLDLTKHKRRCPVAAGSGAYAPYFKYDCLAWSSSSTRKVNKLELS